MHLSESLFSRPFEVFGTKSNRRFVPDNLALAFEEVEPENYQTIWEVATFETTQYAEEIDAYLGEIQALGTATSPSAATTRCKIAQRVSDLRFFSERNRYIRLGAKVASQEGLNLQEVESRGLSPVAVIIGAGKLVRAFIECASQITPIIVALDNAQPQGNYRGTEIDGEFETAKTWVDQALDDFQHAAGEILGECRRTSSFIPKPGTVAAVAMMELGYKRGNTVEKLLAAWPAAPQAL